MPSPADADLARLSAWIYEDERTVRDRLLARGWRIVGWHDHAGTQAACVDAGPWAALVFRGTQATDGALAERAVDFASNLRAWPRLWAGSARAHAGYADALARVRYEARRFVDDAPSDRPLYVAGHSLGGALASLFAAWIYSGGSGPALDGVVTFGAPKAAIGSAYRRLEAAVPVRRYAVAWDLAPAWPPIPGYVHPTDATPLPAPGERAGPLARHDIGSYLEALRG